ncbi:hypothetical protein [Allocoleopsis franciscana]|uniref:Uncharacterized protein n=1 Tax=Allocoleopsis franciscana PCC 7113 TaxID=1173027 RepID=K9WR78_9CYAN|nr:hypothetical protein [Allocoleopsis franciscana]AFZ22296.1 hypothetical protein Mic7113_6734 [Allocoleopsis franciscana PCC 7113]
MKMSGRYAPGLYAGVTGILALVAINAFTIPSSLTAAAERERLNAEAQLEQAKAEAAKKVAEAYSQNAIASFDQLIIDGYTLNNKPPSLNWKLIDPFKKTFIFDQSRQCVGYTLQGKFYFTKYYQGVCNNE